MLLSVINVDDGVEDQRLLGSAMRPQCVMVLFLYGGSRSGEKIDLLLSCLRCEHITNIINIIEHITHLWYSVSHALYAKGLN